MPTASHTLSLSILFRKAWAIARDGARCFGGHAVQYLASALKQAWAEAKALAATVAAQRARVLAEVARIRAENSPLGVARRRRAETAFEVRMAAHRAEMAARTAAYRARWGSGAVAAPRAA
jgi:hypothetical protein